MKRIAYFFFLVLILSSCRGVSLPVETSPSDSCSAKDITEFISTMDGVAQRFENLVHTAEDTPAENLDPLIKEMQGIRQELEDIDTPPCAIETKAALDSYMFSKIQCYFQAYAVEAIEETPLLTSKLDYCSLAAEQLEYYNTQVATLAATE